jgi:hypothetical protein
LLGVTSEAGIVINKPTEENDAIVIEHSSDDAQIDATRNKLFPKILWLAGLLALITVSWWVANMPDENTQQIKRAEQFEVVKKKVAQKSQEREAKQQILQQKAQAKMAEITKSNQLEKIEQQVIPSELKSDETAEDLSKQYQQKITKQKRQIKRLMVKLQELKLVNDAAHQLRLQQAEMLENYAKLQTQIQYKKPLAVQLRHAIKKYYDENSLYGNKQNILGGLVRIRKVGREHQGNDDGAIIARIEHYAGKGNLKDALAESQNLSVAASPYFKQWRKNAYFQLEMQQIINDLIQITTKEVAP